MVQTVQHRNEHCPPKRNVHTMLIDMTGIEIYFMKLGEIDSARPLYRKRLEVPDKKGKLITLMPQNSYQYDDARHLVINIWMPSYERL